MVFYHDFRTIDAPGAPTSTELVSIDDSGTIVGVVPLDNGMTRAFILRGGVFQFIDETSQVQAISPSGANNLGTIVGTLVGPGLVNHVFVDRAGLIRTVAVPNALQAYAGGINDLGEIVGSEVTSGEQSVGWVEKGTGFSTISAPDAFQTSLSDVNDLGQIIGFVLTREGITYSFVDTDGYRQRLAVAGENSTYARGINVFGAVVGYADPFGLGRSSRLGGGVAGFAYFAGQYVTVAVPGAFDTYVNAINDFGEIAGEYEDFQGKVHGFVASPGF